MRQLRLTALSILLCVAIISALVLTAFPLNSRAVAATTWYVDDSGGADFTTIQAAVDAATDGDTIMVAAGTYTESVSTAKSLTFRGAQFGVDARDRSGPETLWVVPSPDTPSTLYATLTTGTVTVDGFHFVGGPACLDLRRATIVFKNNIVEVPEGCSAPANIYYLVKLSGAGSVTVQYNDVSITEMSLLPLVACIDVKISLDPGTVVVDGNRLHNAQVSGGFLFEQGINAGTMTFTNNELYDNVGDGVTIIGKFTSLTATHNSIHDNGLCGILVEYTGTQPGTMDIHNCDIYGNGLYGLWNTTSSGNLAIDASQNFWGDGTAEYPYNAAGAAYGPNISGVTTDPLPGPACVPSVTTSDATSISNTSARLNGSLTSLGSAGSVTVSFVWGTSSGSYPNETTGQVRNTTGAFYFDLGGLTAGTTYYYRAKAVGYGTSYGTEKSFTTTTTTPPSVATSDAGNIASTSARLNGSLTSLGTAGSVTVSFVWGTSSGSYPNQTTGQVRNTTGAFYFDLGGLTAGTTYYYKAKAVGDGTGYGTEKSFTTGTTPTPPSTTTSDASNIANTSARLNGNLTSLGTAGSVTVSFVWGTSPGSYPSETTGQVRETTGAFYFDLGGLAANTTYYYKAKAVGDGTGYGTEKSFTTTITTTPPSVTTNNAGSIAIASARLNGNLTSLGTAGTVTVSFVWGTSSGSYPNETTSQYMTATGAFYFDVGSLMAGTTYYYSAKALGDGVSYGEEKSFTTTTISTSNFATGWYEQFTGYRPAPSLAYVYDARHLCQTFTPSKDHYFNSVSLQLYRTGWLNYAVTVGLHDVDSSHRPVGPALCTLSFRSLSLPTAATTWRTFAFASGYNLSAGTEYALVVSANGGNPSNRINVRTYNADVYVGGRLGTSADAGQTWLMNPDADVAFKEGQDFWHEAQTSNIPGLIVSSQSLAYQTFTASRDHYLNYVSLRLYKAGNPRYPVTISLHNVDAYNQPAGPALCSTTFQALYLTTMATWRAYRFPVGYPVSAGNRYALVLSGSGLGGYVVAGANPAGGYDGGNCGVSTDGGVNWQVLTGPDLAFKEGEYPWYSSFTFSNSSTSVYGQNRVCQTFTPSSSHYLDYVSLSLHRVGNPTYTVTISVYNVNGDHQPTGSALCSTSFAASSLTSRRTSWLTFPWYEFRFSNGTPLSQDVEYALVLSASGGDAANRVIVRINTTNRYGLGQRGQSADGGATWQMLPTQDMPFREGGSESAAVAGSGWYDQFTGYAPSPSVTSVYQESQLCQTFTPSRSYYFDSASLWLQRVGFQNYDVTIALHATDGSHRPSGPALCSTVFTSFSLPLGTNTWRTYQFAAGCQLSAGTEYALVISASGGNPTNKINVRTYAANGYSSGQLGTSTDAGQSWQMDPGADTAFKAGKDLWHESQTSVAPGIAVSSQSQAYQTFTPTRDHYLNYVSLFLYKIGNPTYAVTISLHNVDGNGQPVQPALCSTTFSASSLMRTARWRTYVLPDGYPVSAGTRYALVLSAESGIGSVVVRANASGGYGGGECGLSTDGGETWQTLAGPDLAFREGDYPWYSTLRVSNSSASVYGQNQLCQTFTPSTSHYFEYLSLALFRVGNPMYDVTISLYNVDSEHRPTGSALCSTTFAASSLTLPKTYLTFPWYEFRFASGCELSAGTEYALVLTGNGGDDANRVIVRIYTANRYAGGQRGQSTDGGASWEMLPTQDMTFIEGGVSL